MRPKALFAHQVADAISLTAVTAAGAVKRWHRRGTNDSTGPVSVPGSGRRGSVRSLDERNDALVVVVEDEVGAPAVPGRKGTPTDLVARPPQRLARCARFVPARAECRARSACDPAAASSVERRDTASCAVGRSLSSGSYSDGRRFGPCRAHGRWRAHRRATRRDFAPAARRAAVSRTHRLHRWLHPNEARRRDAKSGPRRCKQSQQGKRHPAPALGTQRSAT
jgi:hypothetical protein